ncbi:MAG: hypothetical protein KME54_21885 [Tolypothrix brevis GSE-NOS-MK-07-07A]|nr:hypothetical protein [Tolypothrix brevis GSE-NOS-MK-07-07A]
MLSPRKINTISAAFAWRQVVRGNIISYLFNILPLILYIRERSLFYYALPEILVET